jgi:hypothetical protein
MATDARPTAEPPAKAKPKRRWLQFSLRTLLVLVLLTGCGFGFLAAYFDDAQVDGDVYYMACACGFKDATITDGKVVLAEPNHDKPAGTVVATIRVRGRRCTVTRIEPGGISQMACDLDVDHLGAKYVEDGRARYVVLVDNWKVYPACFFFWLERIAP